MGHDDVVKNMTILEWEVKKSMMLKAGQDCSRSSGGRKVKK